MSIAIIAPNGIITMPNNEDRSKINEGIQTRQLWMREIIAGPQQEYGWLEIVNLVGDPLKPGLNTIQMVVNEEGLLLGLPVNPIGTMLYSAICHMRNETPIVGNIILFTGADYLD